MLKQLRDEKQTCLTDTLVDAVGFAKAGLADILAGKNSRPAAWTMDIFVKDVCDALDKAGVKFTPSPDAGGSRAQSLAKAIAEVAGIPDQGNLYKQMQRAKHIDKRHLPDIHID
jgi:hypothetical protein